MGNHLHAPAGRAVAAGPASLTGARRPRPRLLATAAVVGLAAIACTPASASAPVPSARPAAAFHTTTPIKHVVVIFDENVSYDHYFGTYPHAANTDGTPFVAARNTPRANGLSQDLLTDNPNAFDPRRLGPDQALTCDQDHGYRNEQLAANGGAMDRFVEFTSRDTCTGQPVLFGEPGLVMDYYDGNTVTALWNYAQRYAMSDNSFDTTFGPSTPGALDLVSGQTHGAQPVTSITHDPVVDRSVAVSPDANGVGTVIGDPDPAFDDCADRNHTATSNLASMTGRNIGDLLNRRNVTWGWFQGGFRPTGSANGFQVCGASHPNVGGNAVTDYVPHHEPFQYYRSTANPQHLPPSSVAAIGQTDQANHQYDLADFDRALAAGNLPAVSFVKPPAYQNGHAANSDPLDEQHFLVETINKLQRSKDWKSTAVIIAYDDSDGWYDHVAPPILNGSADPANDIAELCGGKPAAGGYADRCGPGPRQPLLVISPFARANFVDHTLTEQASVLRFVEDNWRTGRIGDASADARAGSLEGMFDFHGKRNDRPLILDPISGRVLDEHGGPGRH